MALQDILQKIIKEAEQQVAEMKKGFAGETAQVEAEFAKKAEQQASELEAKKQSTLEKLTHESATMARRKSKQLLVAAKHDIIAQALQQLLNHLNDLGDADYEALLKKLFAHVDLSAGTILTSDKRIAVTKKVAPSGFEIKADAAIEGGFIIAGKGVEIDNTFQNIVLSEFRQQLESFFADKLELA